MDAYKIYELINLTLPNTNSTNEKLEILKANKSPEMQMFLELVFDKIQYKYYITSLFLNYNNPGKKLVTIQEIKDALEPLYTRKITGNEAINYMQRFINSITRGCGYIVKCILDRDLHCGVNLKSAEKVYGSLVFKMPYMRCSLPDKISNITYPAILQEKMDGTYRTFVVEKGSVSAYSRSGEEYTHPKINYELLESKVPDGAYIGELIVNGLNGDSAEVRYASNGALNSLNPPEDVTFYAWDYLTLSELEAKQSKINYSDRFGKVCELFKFSSRIKPVKYFEVKNYAEAQNLTRELIANGKEGAVLKDYRAPFEDKTSKFQIKLKLEFEIDVKCTGFTQGNGKFADTFGAIEFESSDGLLKGQCSGISDSERQKIFKEKDLYIGKILTIKGNDITKAQNSNTYGVMHPQYCYFRDDKTEADSIDRILEIVKGF